MLVAAGPGVTALQDYSNVIDYKNCTMSAAQGDIIDTLKIVIHDATSSFLITNEDDIVILDSADPNGWPTVNLLANPSFEGTYSGGVAPSWTAITTGTGITYASSATAKFGSASQSVAIANCANSTNVGVQQGVTLAVDENNNALIALPYMLSAWINVTTPFTGIGGSVIKIDWYSKAGGTFLANQYFVIDSLLRAGTSGWVRVKIPYGMPPSGAGYAQCKVVVVTTSATNSGTLLIDGMQLEYATFGNAAANPQWPIANGYIAGIAGVGNIASGWSIYPSSSSNLPFADTAVGSESLGISATVPLAESGAGSDTYPTPLSLAESGAGSDVVASGSGLSSISTLTDTGSGADTPSFAALPLSLTETGTGVESAGIQLINVASSLSFSLVSTPVLHSTAQQMALNPPMTAGMYGLAQALLPVVPTTTYTITMRYQVTADLTMSAVPQVQALIYDGNYNQIASLSASGDPVKSLGIWKSVTIGMGPAAANALPANAAYMTLIVGVSVPNSQANGTIVVGEVALATSQNSAGALGVYPTPYCDSAQAGCYVDRGLTGLPYRQLRMFAGIVRSAQVDYEQYGGSETDIEVDAQDYSILLSEAPANFVIQPGNDTAAIQQAFQYAINQGHLVGIDYTTYVQHIGTFSGYVFAWQTTRDFMNKLANSLVAAWYVDYYKYLRFTPDLAVSAPYALSSSPDYATTFPFSRFKYKKDSTQSFTAPVIEGSTQLSAPQSQSFVGQATTLSGGSTATVSGVSAALSGAIAAGVTNIPVSSGGASFTNGMTIAVGLGTANQEIRTVGSGSTATNVVITAATSNSHASGDTVAQQTVAAGATAIPVVSGGASFTNGTKLVLGTGYSTAETLTAASGATATNIPLQAATRNAHYATESLGSLVLTKGTTYSAITVAALSGGTLKALTQLTISNGATSQALIVASDAANGATSVNAYTLGNKTAATFVAAADYPSGASVTTTGIQVNSGYAIVTVDSCQVGATQLVLGQVSTNSFAQGYTGLVDPQNALITFQNAAANGAAITTSWRFNTPVLVRVRRAAAESPTGKIRRRIHHHHKIDEIRDQQAAIDRANAELAKRADAVPVGNVTVTSPPWPTSTPIRPGTAIAVTLPALKLTGQLFQIHKVTTRPFTNDGVFSGWKYELEIGWYTADFRVHLFQAMRDLGWQDTNITPDTVLQDVISTSEGWAMTDSANAQNLSIGTWGGPSTWGGTYSWG